MISNTNINYIKNIADFNNETIDKIITNIVQQVKYDLKHVNYKSINPHTKYYVSDMYSIIDFISEEYYDYLSNIPNSAWIKYRNPIIKQLEKLKITYGPILKLFVEKLNLPLEKLFRIVKNYALRNQELVLCCVSNYTDDFIKSICFDNENRFFFENVITRYDLKTNIVIYHNIYCKITCFGTQCFYKHYFINGMYDYEYQLCDHFDVFEYFVGLFGLSIQTKKLYETNNCFLEEFCYYYRNICEGSEPKPKPKPKPNVVTDLFNRMIILSKISIDDIRNNMCNLIRLCYGDEMDKTTIVNEYMSNDDFWKTFVNSEQINALIELFNCAKIDLKVFKSDVIIHMLIEIVWTDNLDNIDKFMCYLKHIGYKIDVEFYLSLFEQLSRGFYRQNYICFGNRFLHVDTLKELYKMKYLDDNTVPK